jgi:L-lactate permease
VKLVDAPFQQIIDPIAGSLVFSAICSALPLILLFVLLGVFKVKAHKVALVSLLLSIVLALVGWQMPLGQTLSAVGAGAVYGMIPILWILINALWIFKLTVATPGSRCLGAPSVPLVMTCGSCRSLSPFASAPFSRPWPVAVVAGAVFAVAQFLTSNFLAVELVDVIAALATIAAVLVMLRFWQPCETNRLSAAATNAPSDNVRMLTGAVGNDGGLEVRAGASTAPSSFVVATSAIDAVPMKTTRPDARQVWTAIAPPI